MSDVMILLGVIGLVITAYFVTPLLGMFIGSLVMITLGAVLGAPSRKSRTPQ